jgi:hypothetical protein
MPPFTLDLIQRIEIFRRSRLIPSLPFLFRLMNQERWGENTSHNGRMTITSNTGESYFS